MWLLKQCPRCRGDLYLEKGEWVCLQCGYWEVKDVAIKRINRLPVGTARGS